MTRRIGTTGHGSFRGLMAAAMMLCLVGAFIACSPVRESSLTDGFNSGPSFESAPGWMTMNTRLGSDDDALRVAWASNIPFILDKEPSGFPTETIRALSVEGIVITAIGPRPYTGGEGFPQLREPLDLSQGFCARDEYEGQLAENVSKCRIDTMVDDQLFNVMVWFGTKRPSDDMQAEANEELARLIIPSS
jgi:hypothetical protein